MAHGSLADYRTVHARYDCDVNDVVLAVIAGALRNWLLSRGEPVTASLTVRAMAPTSVYPADELNSSGPGQAISEWWTPLAWRITSPSRKGRQGADTFDSIDLAMREANKRLTR